MGQANMALNLGVAKYYAGNWSEARELWERSRDLFLAVGESRRRPPVTCCWPKCSPIRAISARLSRCCGGASGCIEHPAIAISWDAPGPSLAACSRALAGSKFDRCARRGQGRPRKRSGPRQRPSRRMSRRSSV